MTSIHVKELQKGVEAHDCTMEAQHDVFVRLINAPWRLINAPWRLILLPRGSV
jgi:hypothetical protein